MDYYFLFFVFAPPNNKFEMNGMVRAGDPFCRNFSQKDISRGDRRAVICSNSGRRSETRTDYYLPYIDPHTTHYNNTEEPKDIPNSGKKVEGRLQGQ